MKLRLRRHETRETLKLELADTSTLHDLRRQINTSAYSSVHLSLNRKDELLAPSPEDTLRSLGVTSGDLIYYSLVRSAFVASVKEIGLVASAEAHQALAPNGESSDGKLGESATTLGPQSEKNQMGVGFAEVNVVPDVDMNIQDPDSGVEDPAEGSTGETSYMEAPGPMEVEQLDVELAAAGNKRLSEPLFLKKILLEKSGDSSELTTLAMSVHAVMLESGFVLFNPGCSDKFSFSKELLTASLRYTLPELMTRNYINTIESVTVTFQSLSDKVVVYGSLGGQVHRVFLDKRRFVPVIDLVMDTLKSYREGSSSIYREVFMYWRMVKDGLVIPLLISLCDKSGLELPPCLMCLPTELKLKILESLPGASVAKMACVCTEIQYLASDNDLWKQKCWEEARHLLEVDGSCDTVNWKAKFAYFWMQTVRQHDRQFSTSRQTLRNFLMRRNRIPFPRIISDPDPFGLFNGDHLYGSVGIQPVGGLGGRGWGRGFSPRCNLGGSN